MSDLRAGDRVKRKSGGPEGTVLKVYETYYAPKRERAEVRWARPLHSHRRGGWKSAVAVDRLVKVSQ